MLVTQLIELFLEALVLSFQRGLVLLEPLESMF